MSRSDVYEAALCAVDAREDVAEGFGTDPAYGCHEDVCAGDDGVESVFSCLCLDAVDCWLEVFVWCFATEEGSYFLAFLGEGGVWKGLDFTCTLYLRGKLSGQGTHQGY